MKNNPYTGRFFRLIHADGQVRHILSRLYPFQPFHCSLVAFLADLAAHLLW